MATNPETGIGEAILSLLDVRTANALTHVVTALVIDGTLPTGAKLPTARAFSALADMSKSTVGQAWKVLAEEGIVETRRRGGTYVVGPPRPARARRYAAMVTSSTQVPVDMANIRGDTLPRPSLAAAIAHAGTLSPSGLPFPEPICEPLESVARLLWPYEPEALLTAHGGPDALALYLQTHVRKGDRVIVETPTYPRILDVIERAGGVVVPLPWRESGPDLQWLHRACAANPALFVYQPSSAQPFGASVTDEWADAAASILSLPRVQVLEVCMVPLMDDRQPSLGSRLPGRVSRVQSYALWFSADIRCSLIGGPARMMEAMWSELTFSTRYVSGVLQHALHFLLTDPTSISQTRACVGEARRRVETLRDALLDTGFSLPRRPGPSLWLPVPDEAATVRRAAAQGIAVFPGNLCCAEPAVAGEPQYVHVGATNIADGQRQMAAVLRQAALGR